MHWDVVEVKPEPGYCLLVRFKDGLAGHIRLRPEELTGALAPLADVQFFEQVFIDYGAVAWPGEIDLAGRRDGFRRSSWSTVACRESGDTRFKAAALRSA